MSRYSTIKVVCEDPTHPGKIVHIFEYGGWGTNWMVNVIGRRKNLIDNAPNPTNNLDEGYPLWPSTADGPLPPTYLRQKLRCRLCHRETPEHALDPTIMLPALNHLVKQGVSRLTLDDLVVVASS